MTRASTTTPRVAACYGDPQFGLFPQDIDGLKLSPFDPNSPAIESLADGSFDHITLMAPPSVLERRYLLAQAFRILRPGGALQAAAPKTLGGSRLKADLERHGCVVTESSKRHHRICVTQRPSQRLTLDADLSAGALQYLPELQLWSQPGVFSWDRLDAGSQRLIALLPDLKGQGADFGCGIGVLASRVLASKRVTCLHLLDHDMRALAAAKRNIEDGRAQWHWADLCHSPAPCRDLDFVVCNPPFHVAGHEDQALGLQFILNAADALRRGGVLWLVANRHLPYEAPLRAKFTTLNQRDDQAGYKIFEAIR